MSEPEKKKRQRGPEDPIVLAAKTLAHANSTLVDRKAKHDKLSQQLVDLEAEILAATKNRDDAALALANATNPPPAKGHASK